MTSPFRAISWVIGDPLTDKKMNQSASNEAWLYQNTPRILYRLGGVQKDGGIKIIAGKIPYAGTPANQLYLQLYFGNFFSPGCQPSVVTTAEPHVISGARKLTSIRGLGSSFGPVDHVGVGIWVWGAEPAYAVQYETLSGGGNIHYIAVGY